MVRIIVLFLVFLMLFGCNEPVETNDSHINLIVMTPDEKRFMNQYGDPFKVDHPNVEIKVIPFPSPGPDGSRKSFETYIDKEKPDLLMAPPPFEEWAKKGILYDLDTLVKKENDPLKGIRPEILESLRTIGNGKLYGLSPTFDSNALFYNKDLFDRYQISYPKSNMTWEEVFGIADEISKKSHGAVSGYFEVNNPYVLISRLAILKRLPIFDPNKNNEAISDWQSWSSLWNEVLVRVQDGAIAIPKHNNNEPSDPITSNLFLNGQAAMIVGNYGTAALLDKKEKENGGKGYFNWDVVAEPEDPKSPGQTALLSFDAVYSIYAKSKYPEITWGLLRFITSEETAKRLSEKDPYHLWVQTSANKPIGEHKVDVFYNFKPIVSFNNQNLPDALRSTSTLAGVQEVNHILEGKESVEEGLKRFKDKLDSEIRN